MADGRGSEDAVVIERTLDAPVELIWQMWIDPDHFAAWYGPDGASIPVARMDVRVGGTRLICMQVETPRGAMTMWFTGEYLKVVQDKRLVYPCRHPRRLARRSGVDHGAGQARRSRHGTHPLGGSPTGPTSATAPATIDVGPTAGMLVVRDLKCAPEPRIWPGSRPRAPELTPASRCLIPPGPEVRQNEATGRLPREDVVKIPKPTDDDRDYFRSLLPDDPRVDVKPMFGNLGGFVNGTMFCGLFGSDVGVRLTDAEDRARLVEAGGGPFGPAERPMGGYLSLPAAWRADPDLAAAGEWVARACHQVAALPPKTTKAGAGASAARARDGK